MSQDDESGTFSRSLRENSRRHRSLYGDTWLYQDLGCSRIEKHSCRVIHSCGDGAQVRAELLRALRPGTGR